MSPEFSCDQYQLELSIAHDEDRSPPADARQHIEACDVCAGFAEGLFELDDLLAKGSFDRAPDLTADVMSALKPLQRSWRAVAAVALVGITVGALVGVLGSRTDIGRAEDLDDLFHSTGSAIVELGADLVIVERGAHPEIPERVYTGSLNYIAPEELAIELVDSTEYPDSGWIPNDIQLVISNGDTMSFAGSPCPVAAMPGCLVEPSVQALRDQPPFDEGVASPLEIVGPGRSLTWSSAIEIVGSPTLDGRPTIQVESTVAAVEMLEAITDRGAWRELHPTDRVLMWLDEETLVPLRLEVFPTDSRERELWQLRHDYRDDMGSTEPIFIVQLSDLGRNATPIETEVAQDAPSRGFVDGDTALPQPTLEPGFEPHRTGQRPLSDGGEVDVATWSDGRSWLMVEATDDWDEPRLFGLSSPFVRPVDLGGDSVGYLAPDGRAVAIHSGDLDVLVSGSVPVDLLLEAAASLDVDGSPIPAVWVETATVEADQLPSGTLVPDVEGWSILGRVDDGQTAILLTGGGARTVLITQEQGTRLDSPTGPDFSEVNLRGVKGRYDSSSATLEWVEQGIVIRMKSDTVGVAELLDLAAGMSPR